MKRIYKTALFMAIVLSILSACTKSSGSMRIAVEVYNGPLSKTLDVQKAELMATVNVTEASLTLLVREFHLSQCRLGCFGKNFYPSKYDVAQTYCGFDDANTNTDAVEAYILAKTAVDRVKNIKGNDATLVINALNNLKSAITDKTGIIKPEIETVTSSALANATTQEEMNALLENADSVLEFTLEATNGFRDPSTLDTNLKNAIPQIHKHATSNYNVTVENIFPRHIREQYPQMFPVRDFKKWLFWGETYNQISIQVEDDLHRVCPVLSDIKFSLVDVLGVIKKNEKVFENSHKNQPPPAPDIKPNLSPHELKFYNEVASVGKLLTEGAEQWATTQMAILPKSRRLRIVVARASMASVELGNEMVARADAIIRQTNGNTRQNLLATSLFLRDSEGTDYLNLVEWMNARPPRDESKWRPADRTRMVERLISDGNWSKVNEAFAQGKGDVNMVFVKDDIGNWNLKSYENDPSELLNAYKNVGTAMLTTATGIISKQTNIGELTKNIAGIKKTNKAANNILLGSGEGSSMTSTTVTAIEERVRGRLTNVANNLMATIADLKKQIEEAIKEERKQEDLLLTQGPEYNVHTRRLKKAETAVLNQNEKQKSAKDEVLKAKGTSKYQKALEAEIGIRDDLDKAEANLEQVNTDYIPIKANYEAAKEKLAKAKSNTANLNQRLKGAPKDAMTRIRVILDGHAEMLEGLQDSIIKAQAE